MAGSNLVLHGLDSAVASLNSSKKDFEVAIKRTTSDFRSRAPAWVAKAVTSTYSISSKEVKGTVTKQTHGKVKLKGASVDNVALVYSGRVLTPIHFKMRPATRPKGTKDESGRTIRRAKPYQVTAEIFKGQRKVLGAEVFLGAGGGGDLPFQRKGGGRLPIQAVRTLSVPQMIGNEDVSTQIQANIDEGLGKRLENNVNQVLKKR